MIRPIFFMIAALCASPAEIAVTANPDGCTTIPIDPTT
jgi:hypothetical protein